MIDKGKKEVLGVMVNAIDYEATVARIIEAAKARQPLGVAALPVHGVMTGVLDRVHRYRLNQLHLVVPDGQPVRWALNWLYGAQLRQRVYGPDLTLYVCEQAAERSLPVFFYGSTLEVLDRLVANLRERFPALQVAGFHSPPFRQLRTDEEHQIVQLIKESGAALTFVGLGCPKQETWVFEHLNYLDMPVLGVGAAFDFHAKRLTQAPEWMQERGLEWLYRFFQEPKRLWRRYVLLNPSFLGLLSLQIAGLRVVRAEDAAAPAEQTRLPKGVE